MTLNTQLDKYFIDRSLSPLTEQQYRICARIFDNWLESVDLQGLDILSIDCDLLSRFVHDYEKTVNSTATVRSKRRIIIAIINHALEPKQTTFQSKFVRIPRKRAKANCSWTPEQISMLIAAAGAIPGRIKSLSVSRGLYAKVLIAVANETGLRRSDLARLTISDIRRNKFSIVQKKTGRVTCCVISSITRHAAVELQAIHRSSNIFAPWTNDPLGALTRLARCAMRRCGLTSPDGALKKVRRSAITNAEIEQAGEGQHRGGHASAETTAEFYLDHARVRESRLNAS